MAGAAALLMALVGWGDALRFHPRLLIERAAVLAATVADPIVVYSETGAPIADYTGFEPRARAAGAAAPEITSILYRNVIGAAVFIWPRGAASAPSDGAEPAPASRGFAAGLPPTASLLADEGSFVIVAPLRNRFGAAGQLEVTVDRSALAAPVDARMAPLRRGAFVLAIAVLAVLIAFPGGARRPAIVSAGAFALFSAITLASVFDLYREAAQSKTEALAASLAARIGAATEIGIDPRTLSGVDVLARIYLEEAPGLSRVELRADGETIAVAGRDGGWGIESRAAAAAGPGLPSFEAVAAAPLSAMLADLWRAGRNFLVLFVACAVAGAILIGLGRSFAATGPPGPSVAGASQRDDANLTKISAIYFLAVAMDSLIASFLPALAVAEADAAGLPQGAGGWPFTAYFFALTAALAPAAALAAAGKGRFLLALGAVCGGLGFAVLAAADGFWALVVGRAVSGAGQGLLLVGVQTVALAAAPAGRRAAAAAVQVFAFNAGFLCGASIGGLLHEFTEPRMVFLAATATGLAALALTAGLDVRGAGPAAAPTDPRVPYRAVFSDRRFLTTLALVGVVSKFILAGVVMFAAPLILTAEGWSADSVGQALMAFAIATLVAAPISARAADRLGDPGAVLMPGALLSAAGVAALALPASGLWPTSIGAAAEGAWFLGALVLLGLGQGVVAAPLIAEVARSDVAERDRSRTLTAYRLSERSGHIAGPAALARLGGGGSSASLAAISVAAAGAAIVYAGLRRRKDSAATGTAK